MAIIGSKALYAKRPSRMWWLALLAISLLALLFRFYRLADMPPGLHFDEAFNGLDAYALLSTPLFEWPLFFTGNFGREPLFIYLLALTQAALGPSATVLRLVPALAGALLTPALAWLGWELAPSLGIGNRWRFALWSGTAAMVMLWSQVFARYAIRVELFVLVEILLWAALWRAWRTNAWRWWGLAGVLAGLSLYTYLPARLLPLVLVPTALLALWRFRPQLQERVTGMIITLAAGLLVAGPLAIYFIRNPLSFSTRSEQVNILVQGGVSALMRNILAILGMVFVQGDENARNNIPGRPVLDWLTTLPYLLGLAYLFRYIMRPAALFLLSWLGVMLLPTLLSDYAPAFQRAFGALPVFAIAIALGLEWTLSAFEGRWPINTWVWNAAGWAVLLLAILLTWLAFATWSALPDLFYARDVGFQQLAVGLANHDGRAYITPRGSDHPTVRYTTLSSGSLPDLRGFDGRICVRVAKDIAVSYHFLTAEDARGRALLQDYLPDSSQSPNIEDTSGQLWATELIQPAGGDIEFPEMISQPVTLSDGIQFRGYWLSQPELLPGERLYTRLFWDVRQQPEGDYTTFVQLLAKTEDGGFERVEGVDAPPGSGSCSTDSWQRGEVVVDELQFVLPADLTPDRTYYLALGFYTPADGARLTIPGQTQDQILIGPLPVDTD